MWVDQERLVLAETAESLSQACLSHGPMSPMDGCLAFVRGIAETSCCASLGAISGIVIPSMAMPSIFMPPDYRILDFGFLRMAIRVHRSERAGKIACGGERGHGQQQRHKRAREYAPEHHVDFDLTTKRFAVATSRDWRHLRVKFNKNRLLERTYFTLLFSAQTYS